MLFGRKENYHRAAAKCLLIARRAAATLAVLAAITGCAATRPASSGEEITRVAVLMPDYDFSAYGGVEGFCRALAESQPRAVNLASTNMRFASACASGSSGSGDKYRNAGDGALYHKVDFPDALPTADATKVSLRDKTKTTLTYVVTINRPEDTSGRASAPVSDTARHALKSRSVLEVAFYCSVCSLEDNLQPEGRLELPANAPQSNKLVFEFTPDKDLFHEAALPSDAPAGAAFVTLVLYERGVRYDQIDIPLDLVAASDADARLNLFRSQLKFASNRKNDPRPELLMVSAAGSSVEKLDQSADSNPDIKLVMSLPTNGEDTIKFTATVYLPRLDEKLKALQEEFKRNGFELGGQPGGQLDFRFDTTLTINNLESELLSFYEILSCLTVPESTEQGKSFRKQLKDRYQFECPDYAGTPDRWSDESEIVKRAAETLYKEGANLFRDLFGHPEYSEVARLVIAAQKVSADRLSAGPPAKPLKLRYHAFDYHLPLQLAHEPVDNFDRNSPSFLGLFLDVSAGKRVSSAAPQNFTAGLGDREKWSVSFAGYSQDPNGGFNAGSNCDLINDSVGKQSCQHFKAFSNLLGGRAADSTIAPLFKSSSIFADLGNLQRRQSLDLIWFYAHGLTRFDDEISRAVARAGSPRILLSPVTNDAPALAPEGISAIRRRILKGIPFPDHPLVVLLACETGTAGSGGTSGQSFADAFINNGARGVVTTEAEINILTANTFGKALLNWLIEGAGPSEAVLQARRDVFAATNGNLWPLLFHYAGAHGRLREN